MIRCKLPKGGEWELPVSAIRIIGEHTNQSGPYLDDYFFVFLTRSVGYEISFYVEGTEELLAELGRRLGSQIACGLVNSADFKSRIMWPPEMQDEPLYDYSPAPEAQRYVGRNQAGGTAHDELCFDR